MKHATCQFCIVVYETFSDESDFLLSRPVHVDIEVIVATGGRRCVLGDVGFRGHAGQGDKRVRLAVLLHEGVEHDTVHRAAELDVHLLLEQLDEVLEAPSSGGHRR